MTAVLDQFEVEYKECYISGSYDQVVMGKMFYPITIFGNKKYVYGERGVVYGSINSSDTTEPGTTNLDKNNSVSYRLQPYKEKAGNSRVAKHLCYDERIYDTLLPNALSCFKINGAQPTILSGTWLENPGFIPPGAFGLTPSAIDEKNAFLMFDNYTKDTSKPRSNLNPIVDNSWNNSFPFEPKYSKIQRNLIQNFKSIKAKYRTIFSSSLPLPAGPNVATIPSAIMPTIGGIIFGNIGPTSNFIGTYSNSTFYSSSSIYHHWFADTDLSKNKNVSYLGIQPTTGSMTYEDNIKTVFGFGDGMTVYYDRQFIDSNDPTGYQRRGTKNLPTFRSVKETTADIAGIYIAYINRYYTTGSLWCTSPIIRGWKYGIHNGLPDYTHSYYRQGKYGQFRDMLEQRRYTAIVDEKTNYLNEGVVTVKFLDQDENLTAPVNTQSQNLSLFATSSLPYFDLEQRNRPENTLQVNNLQLVNLNFDVNNNLRI